VSEHQALERRRFIGDLTAPGRSSFDWALFFSAAAILVPVSGLVGVYFADRSRRRGYGRWKAACAMSLWCLFLGVMLRGALHLGIVP
jgi:hypothetical protein